MKEKEKDEALVVGLFHRFGDTFSVFPKLNRLFIVLASGRIKRTFSLEYFVSLKSLTFFTVYREEFPTL